MSDSLLHYNQKTGLWEGEDGERQVSMDHKTFLGYAVVWVQMRMGTETPTREQIKLGVEHCRRLAYWRDCEKNYDPEVKVRRGGVMKTVSHYYD